MSPRTFQLVILVSFAHALVHAFEVSLSSVEQMIGDDFQADRAETGLLGTVWRFPFGAGALLAGWLADRYGSKPLLLIFLGGCVATALTAAWAPSMAVVTGAMFAMGCFASIYHPAGLALISRETTAENRPKALGWHGILGSVGFTCAPLLAAATFSLGTLSWRQYYLLLCVPAAVVALLIAWTLKERRPHGSQDTPILPSQNVPADAPASPRAFFLLVTVGALSGLVYAAFIHFLPRYLDTANVRPSHLSPEGFRNLLAGLVLGFAIVGQAIAGRIARPGRLEVQLAIVLLANSPLLFWMAVAEGPWRLAAACSFALVHFMNQPLYNSLIAQYVSPARRSLGYGFSNMICFGFGALGPLFAGLMTQDLHTYGGLALLAMAAGLLAFFLVRSPSAEISDEWT